LSIWKSEGKKEGGRKEARSSSDPRARGGEKREKRRLGSILPLEQKRKTPIGAILAQEKGKKGATSSFFPMSQKTAREGENVQEGFDRTASMRERKKREKFLCRVRKGCRGGGGKEYSSERVHFFQEKGEKQKGGGISGPA